ncbi:MAG: hypothetical protein JNK40_02065 [Chromatiales bacterium]|nr:hypothetical protein [Chromatiales bacterium]
MRTLLIATATVLLVAACGGKDDAGSAGAPGPAAESLPTTVPPAAGTPPATAAPVDAGQTTAAATPAGPVTGLGGRTGELVNPDNNAMVFLYHDLAGITPRIDRWVEEDTRVKFAPAIDKPALRDTVRAELEAGMAAVKGAGVIRLSLNSANLSDYDPTYGEFTVRALAPSSVVTFDALGQKVTLRFGNGRTAQIWRVPAAEAQAIRDKVAMGYNVDLDVLLVVKSVVPGPAGGTITADVIEYEMRETRGGTTIARVRVPQA